MGKFHRIFSFFELWNASFKFSKFYFEYISAYRNSLLHDDLSN